MNQSLSDSTKSRLRKILVSSKNPASGSQADAFIAGVEETLAIYLQKRADQRRQAKADVTAGAMRRQLAKVTRAAERLQKQIHELPLGGQQYVKQAFVITGGDVLPFVNAMNVLLRYASPPGRGRPDDMTDLALCVGLMNHYRNVLGMVPKGGSSRFVRLFDVIASDRWVAKALERVRNGNGDNSYPRELSRRALAHPGFTWLKDPID